MSGRAESPVSESGFDGDERGRASGPGVGTGGRAGGRVPGEAGTARRIANTQATLARRTPKPTVVGAGGMFAQYKPVGARIEYSENKVGIMPNLPDVLKKIADAAGVSLEDGEVASRFLEALVTDVYVNAYSDKQVFDGEIVVGDFQLKRTAIKSVLDPIVGTAYRRFARAMAPLVVQVMHDNYDAFGDILDKRCGELGLSTRADAVLMFDGADALVLVDRASAQRNAEAKALALSYRSSDHSYAVTNSAKADGAYRTKPVAG